MATSTPWWQYSRIDNFGQIDPAGPYYKPDTNIQIPGNYPVINLLPGTVTSIQNTSWGQTVVTVKLDTQVNPLATHEFYEHMSSASVLVGQHLNTGDLVGYNNPAGEVPLGYGFYSGDVYGSGSAWSILQQDLAPGGAGLLNPVSVITAAQNGTLTLQTSSGGGGIPGLPDLSGVMAWLNSPARILKMITGLLLVGVALYMLASPANEQTIKTIAKVGMAA